MFRAPDRAVVLWPDKVAEYRLDVDDVAAMLGTDRRHIYRWSDVGRLCINRSNGLTHRQTIQLNPWRIPYVKALAFNLTDVMRFAAKFEGPNAEYGDGIEWAGLPLQLAVEWNIVAALDRHRELGNLDTSAEDVSRIIKPDTETEGGQL
jgi:hypothetical protein